MKTKLSILKETIRKIIKEEYTSMISEDNHDYSPERSREWFLSRINKAKPPTGVLMKMFGGVKKGDYSWRYFPDEFHDVRIWYYKNKPIVGSVRTWVHDSILGITYLNDPTKTRPDTFNGFYSNSDFFNFLIKNKVGQPAFGSKSPIIRY
jgi:hypothetical protein